MGNNQVNRPRWHMTAEYGWINDPNGLVFHDGIYEVYYQHNPKDVVWGNMTWGHQRTRDLVHFEKLEPVLFPDEFGTMFSGCGIINEQGLLGLPRDALIFFYTVAPEPKKGKPMEEQDWFSIRCAYSLDGGMTLVKTGKPVLESLAISNRDPKVFYHEPSGAYIMVLWIENHDVAVFRSKDLLHFELSAKFELEGAFECPDLFELPVEGTDEKKWVFWAGDGSYYVGEFDGYIFTQTQPRRKAYETKLPYAAQTFSGTGKEVISLSWLRTECRQNQFTGMLSLPRVLGLVIRDGACVLTQKLPESVREILLQESGADSEAVIHQQDGFEIVLDHGIEEKTSSDGTKLIINEI